MAWHDLNSMEYRVLSFGISLALGRPAGVTQRGGAPSEKIKEKTLMVEMKEQTNQIDLTEGISYLTY